MMEFRELFEEQFTERTGCSLIVASDGFLVVRFDEKDNFKSLFIADLFVSKKGRKKARHTAVALLKKANDLAISLDCIKIRGIIHIDSLNATSSLKASLYYGFYVIGADNGKVFVEMDINKDVKTAMRKV